MHLRASILYLMDVSRKPPAAAAAVVLLLLLLHASPVCISMETVAVAVAQFAQLQQFCLSAQRVLLAAVPVVVVFVSSPKSSEKTKNFSHVLC